MVTLKNNTILTITISKCCPLYVHCCMCVFKEIYSSLAMNYTFIYFPNQSIIYIYTCIYILYMCGTNFLFKLLLLVKSVQFKLQTSIN